MHGTRHLSSFVEKTKRAVSPGRMSDSPGKNYEKWAGDNTTYLAYYNSTIKRNDMYTLANPDVWLEDNTINFWSEYLQHEELAKFPKANIDFLYASQVSVLKNGTEEIGREMFGNSGYTEDRITHIFVPVNDDRFEDHEYKGLSGIGTHWSLLVVSLIDNVAFHYDSLGGMNHAIARNLVGKIQAALPHPRTLRFVAMDNEDSPQQTDGSNCGTFVCIVMKHLLVKRLLRADANQKVTMSTRGPGPNRTSLGHSSTQFDTREVPVSSSGPKLTLSPTLGMKGQDIDYNGARKMLLAVIDDRVKYALANNKVDKDGKPKIV